MDIVYNGHSLQTSDIVTSDIDHNSNPDQNTNIAAIAHGNHSAINFIDYPQKIINIAGQLIGESDQDIVDIIDTFKGYLVGQDRTLDIDHGSSVRRYKATPTAVKVDRPGGLLYGVFSVKFTCADPFGTDTTATTLLNETGKTSGSASFALSVGGNAPWQVPIIKVSYSAISGGTAKTVMIGNNNTGQQISVTRNWLTNDVLEIDVSNTTVKVNGVEVAFAGAFPEFEPGAGTLAYSDNFTSRTFAIEAKQYRRFM